MRNGNAEPIRYKRYVAGWLDSSIRDFLPYLPDSSRQNGFALITSLDSDLCPRKLLERSPELKSLSKVAKPIGNGFLVPTSLILDDENSLFYGFDEVWFFPHDAIGPKPESTWIVGPQRIDQAKIDRLGSWLAANDCTLALGDGDGLNVIMKANGLIRHLLAASMSQPQPALRGEGEDEGQ